MVSFYCWMCMGFSLMVTLLGNDELGPLTPQPCSQPPLSFDPLLIPPHRSLPRWEIINNCLLFQILLRHLAQIFNFCICSLSSAIILLYCKNSKNYRTKQNLIFFCFEFWVASLSSTSLREEHVLPASAILATLAGANHFPL